MRTEEELEKGREEKMCTHVCSDIKWKYICWGLLNVFFFVTMVSCYVPHHFLVSLVAVILRMCPTNITTKSINLSLTNFWIACC